MTTKAKTTGATETVEQVVTATQEAWKDGFDKATVGFDQIGAQSQENVDALIESVNVSTKGFEAINAEAISYSKKAMEDGAAVAQAAAGAKSLQELIELNTVYTKTAFEAYLGAATKMGELFAATAKDASAPLSARFSATIEAAQNVTGK